MATTKAVDDGWLIELVNERNRVASFFVQCLYFNVPKNTPRQLIDPQLVLLSDNTANPHESILLKLSATEEQVSALKGCEFRIAYGGGTGQSWHHLDLTLP